MTPVNFTLKQLRYFAAAGELSSVTQAAEMMFVSQPSISSAIMHLEDVTGLKLFIRHHAQGLTLTSQGQQFYRKARKLLEEANTLAKFAESLGSEVSGTLKLVGFPSFTPRLVPVLMKQFSDKYPNVILDCDEMHQRDLIRGILDSHYDMGITYDMELPSTIDFFPLASLPPYALLSKDHKFSDRESISLKELEPFPLILLDWPVSRQYFTSLFLNNGLKPNIIHRTQSIGMTKGMIESGFGYSLLNAPITDDKYINDSDLIAIPISDSVTALTMGIATLHQNPLTPAGEAFLTIMKDYTVQITASLSIKN
ncbi:LysR family transcriptional regulator [Psychromonas sp. SR45-3]|uniref:LysR family transcriptional regulator n=1 Tax=Psychromonas sp. SR45-3 TaxID=2760930 RepID=UPI0015F8E5EF|nr:LysR family transcriptional regulator [Psychromonas sp. SR45-3]MBB1271348.1 LysR family transcriptional regulator [Psychromonas sp. SR45-3]